jgi:hypothetical protein
VRPDRMERMINGRNMGGNGQASSRHFADHI